MSLLQVINIQKSFGAVHVLHGIDFSVEAGQVVGLVGDNGAGKSTLMKIITGIHSADKGSICFRDQDITALNPGDRRELGIEMIYQDLALARQQDVASNIFLGREPRKSVLGMPWFVDRQTMHDEAEKMIDRLGANLPSISRPVGTFSGGQQQTVAIARALTFNPSLVIMDEPTAALAVKEVQSVLNLIRQLKEQNIAVVLISHRLNDVLSVTDHIVVLRHGRAVSILNTADTTMNTLVSEIVGSDAADAALHESQG